MVNISCHFDSETKWSTFGMYSEQVRKSCAWRNSWHSFIRKKKMVYCVAVTCNNSLRGACVIPVHTGISLISFSNFFQIQFFNRFFNFYFLLYELLTYFNGNIDVLLFLKPILVLKRGLTWTRAKSWNFALWYRKSGGLIITYKNSLLKQKYAVIEGTVERFIAKYFQSLYKRQCIFEEVFPLSLTFSIFNETNREKCS